MRAVLIYFVRKGKRTELAEFTIWYPLPCCKAVRKPSSWCTPVIQLLGGLRKED
jgi:hypothetical protein